LQAAFSGLTDKELVQRLNVQLGTVKKHWLDIHDRTAKAPRRIVSFD
jgi:DNA-binding NarL/FixJ family response regulator